jgi:hypothetical protein
VVAPLLPAAALDHSGLSYILLLDLSANFVRYFVSQKWHDQCLWGGAAQVCVRWGGSSSACAWMQPSLMPTCLLCPRLPLPYNR